MPKYDVEKNIFSFVASSTKKLSILKSIFNKIGNVTWFVIITDNDYKHYKHPSLKPCELILK